MRVQMFSQVADFGLARLIALRDRICTDTYGTVTHMPPELLSGGDLSQAVVICMQSLLFPWHCDTCAIVSC